MQKVLKKTLLFFMHIFFKQICCMWRRIKISFYPGIVTCTKLK